MDYLQFLIQILMEEIRLKNGEKKDSEYRENSKIGAHLENSLEYRKSEPRPAKTSFQKEFSPTVKLLIETMIEEKKLVASKKFGFEDRHKPILLSFLGIFGLSNFRPREQKIGFLLKYSCSGLKFLIEILMEGIKTMKIQENWV